MNQNPAHRITGYVLAGGLSRRMGQDKAFLEIGGTPLIQHAVHTLEPACSGVRILSGPHNHDRDALLSCYAHLVSDPGPEHMGPLGALLAALHDLCTDYALLLAVDQPAMSNLALAHLCAAALERAPLAAAFSSRGTPEPLPLLVSKRLLPSVERAVGAGQRRLLNTVQACCAQAGQPLFTVPAPPSQQDLFLNFNTPDDFQGWIKRTSSNQSAAIASEVRNG